MIHPIFRLTGAFARPRAFGERRSCGIKKPTATRLDLAPDLFHGTLRFRRNVYDQPRAGRLREGEPGASPERKYPRHRGEQRERERLHRNPGVEDARGECRSVAELLGLEPAEVAVCSTGVIGLPMPMMRIYPKFPELAEGLSRDKGHEVAQAVMTSDTKEKNYCH